MPSLTIKSKMAFAMRSFAACSGWILSTALGLTAMEVSVNSLPPGAAVPLLHTHREHEELYLFVSVAESFGSMLSALRSRLPAACASRAKANRCWRNTGSEPLLYVVIQAKAGSAAGQAIEDGQVCAERPEW
jgi:uncharacterized cupin superfamily protein